MQWIGINFFNPISHFFVSMTKTLSKAFAKNKFLLIKGINFAILALIIIVEMLKLTIIVELRYNQFPHISGLLLLTVSAAISTAQLIFIFMR